MNPPAILRHRFVATLPLVFLLLLGAAGARAQYPFETELALPVDRLLADPIRPRVYALHRETNTIKVINTTSLTVTKTITVGPEPRNMALSPDNSKLYVTESGDRAQGVAIIDLTTLTVSSYVATPIDCYGIAVGLGDHLYLTSTNGGSIDFHLADGSWKYFPAESYGGGILAITPDRQTLFRGENDSSPGSLVAYDVSGADPVVRDLVDGVGEYGIAVLSPDAATISYPRTYSSALYNASDLTQSPLILPLDNGYASITAFSADNSKFFQALDSRFQIEVFHRSDFARVGTIAVGGYSFSDMVTDASGQHLFVAVQRFNLGYADYLQVFNVASQISSPLVVLANRGQAFSYQIMADNGPTSFTASGLPDGLSLNAATGVISGTPSQGGAFAVTVSAIGDTTVSATLTLQVDPYTGLFLFSDLGTQLDVGPDFDADESGSYTVFADPSDVRMFADQTPGNTAFVEFRAANGKRFDIGDYPNAVPTVFSDEVPDSPQFSVEVHSEVCDPGPASFVIRQIAFDAAGLLVSFQATFSRHCGNEIGATNGEVFYRAGSVIKSPLHAEGQIGQSFTYQLETNITTPHWEVPGLPAGLNLDATTGLITGTPTTSGRFSLNVTATGPGSTIPAVDVVTFDIANVRKPLNLSTRLQIGSGDSVGIAGFILSGGPPKPILIRGIGPSLGASGVTNAIQDPVLELHDGNGALITTNDNWKDAQADVIAASGLAPLDEREAALLLELQPLSYTAILRDKNNLGGVGLVEVYDLLQTSSAKLANLSTRGFTGTDDNVMIGGFIVGGTPADTSLYVVRALGPSLKDAGVNGWLADPILELYDRDGNLSGGNDNWEDGTPTDLKRVLLAPSDSHEAAVYLTVRPGNYTAIVRGAGNSTGIALIEVYSLL